jgi:hypothetical protein
MVVEDIILCTIPNIKNKIGKKEKYENYHIATGDFDDNPNTPDEVVLLDELNRLVGYNGYSVEKKPDLNFFNKTVWSLFPDPETNAAFRKTKGARILKGWLKLSSAEKAEYGGKLKLWAAAYVKDHPGAFEPTLQQTITTWMTDFSKQYALLEQAKVTKKE